MSGALQAVFQNQRSFGAAPDAQFNYVTMLLHGDGTNGAQNNTFLDSSTNNFTITRNGNTTQGSFSPYGSNWSNYFNGSTNTLDVPTSANNSVGTGSFCFEAFIYMENASAQQFLVANASSGGLWIGFNIDAANKLAIGRVATAIDNEVSYTWTNGTWYHIAVNRSGTNLQFFVNGTQVGSTGSNSVNYPSQGYRIGSETTQKYFSGYISNFRLVRASVYTTTFTPSTTPLTAITDTAILTCQSNRFIDNSTNAFALTANGSLSVQRFNPFGTATAYSTSVIGGSGYFDGTGDSLSIASASALNIGSADMTMEFWMLIPSAFASNYRVVFAKGNNASGGNSYAFEGMGSGDLTLWVNTDGGSGWNLFAGTTIGTPTVGAWNHVVLCRSGTTWYSFMNGTRVLNTTGAGTVTASSTAVTIGDFSTGGFEYTGYVSNLRLVNGTAVYANATTCTVPTTPLTAVTNTQLLTNFTNGAIFDNAMMNNLETVGNAQISTSVKKYGTGSMYFDGTGDYLTSNAPTNNYAFGTGDFTIEGWFYLNTTASSQNFLDFRSSPSDVAGALYFDTTNVNWYVSGANRITGGTLSTSTWYHIAVCRSGTSTKLFISGTQVGSTYTDTNNYICPSGRPYLGALGDGTGTLYFNGYMDDIRITKGYARYTANFTPPTAALPDTGPY